MIIYTDHFEAEGLKARHIAVGGQKLGQMAVVGLRSR
jgi:hypothetical protein